MKVLFDHQIFGNQKFGGISRYFYEIINHLPCEKKIMVKYSDNVFLRQNNLVPDLQRLFDPRDLFLKGMEFRGKGTLYQLVKRGNPSKYLDPQTLNKLNTIEQLKKQDFDVFHPTYFDDYFLDYLGNKPFVLTIHDLNHELFPEFYSSKEELDFVAKRASMAKMASHIIAVSENTKKDIINVLGIDRDKISVIYHAVSFKPSNGNEILDTPQNYLLYVGDRVAEYKNFKFMARAIAPLLKEYEALSVICTGSEFNKREVTFIDHLGLQGRFISKYIPDNLFYKVYNKAIALIYPSYYEGFGIPIIEAFKCGCPAIISTASCFPEIAGDAALYFEPKSMYGLREQVNKLLLDESLRNSLVQKGLLRAEEFSWEKSARQTLHVYNSVSR